MSDYVCPKGCKPTRTRRLGTMGTLMYWEPVYDENGKVVDGHDPNTYTTEYSCDQCGAHWTVARRMSKRTVSEPWWPIPLKIIEADLGGGSTWMEVGSPTAVTADGSDKEEP